MKTEFILEWIFLFEQRYPWLSSDFSEHLLEKYNDEKLILHVQERIRATKMLLKDLEALLFRLTYDKKGEENDV